MIRFKDLIKEAFEDVLREQTEVINLKDEYGIENPEEFINLVKERYPNAKIEFVDDSGIIVRVDVDGLKAIDSVYSDLADEEDEETVSEAKKAVRIKVKHPGILEVPEGKSVDELPPEHFIKLAKKKGYAAIIRALNNLQVWNKKRNPKLSKWAKKMKEELRKAREAGKI